MEVGRRRHEVVLIEAWWRSWVHRVERRQRALLDSCYSGRRNADGFGGANFTNHGGPFFCLRPYRGDAPPRQFHHIPFVALVEYDPEVLTVHYDLTTILLPTPPPYRGTHTGLLVRPSLSPSSLP